MKRPEGFDRPQPAPPERTGRPSLRRDSGRRTAPERVGVVRRPVDAAPPAVVAGAPARGAEGATPADPVTEPIPITVAASTARPTSLGPGSGAGQGDDSGATEAAPRVASVRRAAAEVRAAARRRRRAERAEMRRFTRRSRHRRAAWLTAAGIAVVLVGLVAVAVFSPLLALTTIRVEGTQRLDAEQLEQAVDGQLGTPLALLDEGRITDDLSEFRLIQSYATELEPPGTLVIHVVERTPIGAVRVDGGVELVDPAGIVVDTLDRRPRGVPLVRVETGGIGGPAYTAVAEVLLAMPQDLMGRIDVITATTPDDVSFELRGGGRTVVWGNAERSEHKALVLKRLVQANGSAPGEYDVSAPGSAVFRAD